MADATPNMRVCATEADALPVSVTAAFEALLKALDLQIGAESDLLFIENIWDPACGMWLRAVEEAETAVWTCLTGLGARGAVEAGDAALLEMAGFVDAALGAEDPREMAEILEDMERRAVALLLPGHGPRARQVNCLLTLAQVKLFTLADLPAHVLLPEDLPQDLPGDLPPGVPPVSPLAMPRVLPPIMPGWAMSPGAI